MNLNFDEWVQCVEIKRCYSPIELTKHRTFSERMFCSIRLQRTNYYYSVTRYYLDATNRSNK